jgi:hypothetical protein
MVASSATLSSSALAFCGGIADADVDDDFLKLRALHDAGVAELLDESGNNLSLVLLDEAVLVFVGVLGRFSGFLLDGLSSLGLRPWGLDLFLAGFRL